MPVTYEIESEAGILRTRCRGQVTFEEAIGHFRALEGDDSLPRPVDALLDLTETQSLPETNQIRSVAVEVDRVRSHVQWGASAIVASGDALYGMTRMFHAFVERFFAASNVFRNIEEAERWLASMRSAPAAAD